MAECGIDFQDLLLILSNGTVDDSPELDPRNGDYKYKVRGPTIDDDPATAGTVILGRRSIMLITVY